jgi:Ca2+-binding RTX toxin-like protein
MFRCWLRPGRAAVVLAAAVALGAGAMSAGARPRLSACKNLIKGTPASETLDGTPAADRILGLGGDDRLIGEDGNDCLDGGLDNDELIGGKGDDLLEGETGSDVIEGDAGADEIDGQEGDDRLDGGAGADSLAGGGGGDFMVGGTGADKLAGAGGADRIYGGPGRDAVDGGQGNDDIREVPDGYAAGQPLDWGHNKIDGGPGRDRLNVANGRRDAVDCGAGRDTIRADKGDRLRHCEQRHYLISPFPDTSPGRGGRTRTFVVKFRSVATVGKAGDFFSVAVKGPPGRGCGSLEASSAGMSYHRDRAVRYRLRPFTGKGKQAHRWCRGRYSGKVEYMASATAKGAPIGRFAFRVRG